MAFLSVPDSLKDFYGIEYLYGVLGPDVLGDTIGTLLGNRQPMRPVRQLFEEGRRDRWAQLDADREFGPVVRELFLNRIAVSKTRKGEPITLMPWSTRLVGDPTRDKPVANAYRSIGGFTARFFDAQSKEDLRAVLATWSQQPLAQMAVMVVEHAQHGSAGTLDVQNPESKDLPVRDDLLVEAREDVRHLFTAWKTGSFGPGQQFEQLRALLCFHTGLYLLRTAAGSLSHRQETKGVRPFFVCDAAQVVGAPIAHLAYQSLAFWTARIKEANVEVCYRTACGVEAKMSANWGVVFQHAESSRAGRPRDALVGLSQAVAQSVFEGDRRRRNGVKDEFQEALITTLEHMYGQNRDTITPEERRMACARALYVAQAARGRVLFKVIDCLRAMGDGAGWIGPKGTHQRKRFMLRADLLETLAVVHMARKHEVSSDDDPLATGAILSEWFRRYGLVVDASRPEVKAAIDNREVDERVLAHLPDSSVSADNLREFEDRLVELRLARRFSDASVCLDDGRSER